MIHTLPRFPAATRCGLDRPGSRSFVHRALHLDPDRSTPKTGSYEEARKRTITHSLPPANTANLTGGNLTDKTAVHRPVQF
jgi:hypothetical protein